MVAWNDEMTSIKPGEEKLYEFTADYAGVWMYHCGSRTRPFSTRQRHVRHAHRRAEGRIRPGRRGGFFVQGEWYLRRASRATSELEKAASAVTRRRTSWSSTALPTSTRTTRSRCRPGSGFGSSCSTPGRTSTAAFHIDRDDLQRRDQGGNRAHADNEGGLGLPGRRPLARAGRDHRTLAAGGRALPDRHARLQLSSAEARVGLCSRPATATP